MKINVRISLGSYDFAHPAEKQTQVYVEIEDVARASYLLPPEMFHALKDREWPEALDVAHEHYERQWVVTDSASKAARAAVHTWLVDDTNRDEMNAAWFEDRARRDPVARALLKDKERLTSELEQMRKTLACVQVRELLESAEHANSELEKRLLAAETERNVLRNDAINMRGALSPNGEARKVPMPLGETLAPAVDWLIGRVAELEALTPAPIQTCRTCGAGYDYGQPCPACQFNERMTAAAKHVRMVDAEQVLRTARAEGGGSDV